MPLVEKKTKVYKYKYYVYPILITLPGKEDKPIFIEPVRILNLAIDRNFVDNIMPTITITFTMNKKDYKDLIVNKNKATLTLKIDKIRYFNEEDKNIFRQNWINCNFSIMTDSDLQNNTEFMDEYMKNTDKPDVPNKTNEKQLINITVTCFDKEILKGFKKTVNIVSSSINSASALGYIFNKAKFKSIMMTPPDNKSSKRLIMPESDIQEAIEYIHTNIGIYDTGYRLFADMDNTFYFLSGDPNSKCFKPEEMKNIYFDCQDLSAQPGLVYGMYSDDKETLHIVLGADDINYKSNSAAAKELSPTKIKTIGGDTVGDSKGTDDGFDSGENVLVIDNKRGNDHYVKSLLFKTRSGKLKAFVRLIESDLSELTPNKNYYINYVNNLKLSEKYSGLYKCNRIITEFNRSGDYFKAVSAMELMK